MQMTQRILLVLLVSICLVIGITAVSMRETEKRYGQWESVQTERFLQKICRTGSLFTEEYDNYGGSLNQSGAFFEIQIEEYRKEWDRNGKNYYCLVTWDELNRALWEDGSYVFHEESVIKLVVNRKLHGRTGKKEYYVMISEKE